MASVAVPSGVVVAAMDGLMPMRVLLDSSSSAVP